MKVVAEWWGIQIAAEDAEDERILKELHDRVGGRADGSGTITASTKESFSWGGGAVYRYLLTFMR